MIVCVSLDSRKNSAVSSIDRTETREGSRKTSSNKPSLLLHNLSASIEFENNSSLFSARNRSKVFNPYDEFCLQHRSKLHADRDLSKESSHLSLKEHSERMQTNIKIAIARSARNSHMVTRRQERIY